jgi:hypothetical protein
MTRSPASTTNSGRSMVERALTVVSQRKSIILIGIWLVLFVSGVLLGWRSLHQDWFLDDLYSIRPYTASELAHAWTGPDSPADLGTQAYRPLSILYYDLVGSLAHENTAIARLIQIAILALGLTLFAGAIMAAGVSPRVVLVACLIALAFRNTWWALVWPTDGMRGFTLVWVACALWAALKFSRASRGGWGWAMISASSYTLGFLTREESAFFAVLIPLITVVITRNRRRAFVLLVLVGVLTIGLFALRAVLVPGAISPTNDIYFFGLKVIVAWTYFPRQFGTVPMWIIMLLVWLAVLFKRPWANNQRRPLLWLVSSGIALTPALFSLRGDNLFYSHVFLALFFADALLTNNNGLRWRQQFAQTALAVLVVGNVVSHRDAQRVLEPDSVDRVLQAHLFLSGEWQDNLHYMPPQRIAGLEAARNRWPQSDRRHRTYAQLDKWRWIMGGWGPERCVRPGDIACRLWRLVDS